MKINLALILTLLLTFSFGKGSEQPDVYKKDASALTVEGKRKKIKPFKLPKQEKKEGFELLFDGTNMEQWVSNTDEYVVEEGYIVMHPAEGGGYGNLYTKEAYDNFVLRFEFQLTPGANSGLGLRHEIVPKEKGYLGMELQILDNGDEQYKDLKPYQYHGSVYNYIPAKRGYLKPVGEWNYQEVVADGNRIQVILNGTIIVDGDLKEATKDIPKEKIQAGLFTPKGHIAFLGHDSVVKFKNIRVKKLK